MPGAVFADITWMGFTGASVAGRVRGGVRRRARWPRRGRRRWCSRRSGTAASFAGSKSIAPAATVIERAGFGAQFIHRTGHSLGENVHGNGVHMDDYETHDDRRLLPGTGFTIEPGVYTDRYGVRTEINMFVGEHEARVTGPAAEGNRPAD